MQENQQKINFSFFELSLPAYRKRALSKMQTRGFYALKYIQKRKNTDLPKKFKYKKH